MANPHWNPNQQDPYNTPQQGGYNPAWGAHAARQQVQDAWQAQQGVGPYVGTGRDNSQAFMTKVFGWMGMGLALTAMVAWLTFSTGFFIHLLPFMMPLLLLQLGIVFGLGFGIRRNMSAPVAIGAFLLYAGTMGLTLSTIFVAYTMGSIASVFLTTAMTFGFMFVYGWTTKKDLTSMGSLLFMGLIGIILASVVNMFLGNSMLDLVISAVGVLVFVGLTAYDAQKIKQMGAYGFGSHDQEQKSAIMGALALYLDFINLFLMLLRLFDRR